MKKLLATLLASTMALTAIGGLVACGDDTTSGGGNGGKELKPSQFSTVTNLDDPLADKDDNKVVPEMTITIWAPGGTGTSAVTDLYTEILQGFTSDSYHNGKYKNVKFEFENHDEGSAYDDIGADAENGGPDVFFFSSSQASILMDAQYLLPLRGATGSYYSAAISQRDNGNFVDLVTDKDGYMHAFPLTADDGYMLAYRKDIITDVSTVEKLDDILAIGYEKNMSFSFEFNNGFYGPAFLYGAGARPEYKNNNTDFSVWNGEAAATGAKAFVKYYNSGTTKDGETPLLLDSGTNFMELVVDDTVIAGTCGAWAMTPPTGYEDKIGFAKLPMVTADDVKTVENPEWFQLGGYVGGKYVGVNARKSKATTQVAMAVANYISNSAAQLKRFKEKGSGPSNLVTVESAEVKASPQLSALAAQFALPETVVNANIPGSMWKGWTTWADMMKNGEVTASNLKLGDLVAAVTPAVE